MSEIMEYHHERPSIMMLNDDCFYNIMAKLNILDLMQLKQVNKRLNCLVQFSRCKELNLPALFPETLTNSQFREIVDLCCLSLTSMEVQIQSNLTTENILDVVEKCGKLNSLKVIDGESYSPSWIEMLAGSRYKRRISRSVRRLDLCVKVHLNDILKAFPNLEKLRCRSVQVDNYTERETPLRNKLKSLEIYAHNRDQYSPLSYVPSLPMLEKFHLSCEGRKVFFNSCYSRQSRFIILSNNKKLKEMYMKHWALNDNELLVLGNSIYGQLETLGFHYCPNITEAGFKSFLTSQPNLKTVDIRSYKDEPGSYAIRCLNNYVETRPVKEEPLTVITNWDSSEFSPNLNIVQVSGPIECEFCEELAKVEL